MSPGLKIQKDLLAQKIIKDIGEFFIDKRIPTCGIRREFRDSIKFFAIHFGNDVQVDFDVINEGLLKYGYIPKYFTGNLPESYTLTVLVNKQL